MDVIDGFGHVIGYNIGQAPEPERRKTIQHMPFERDPAGQHDIERGNTVGGNYQQVAAEVIRIPHLAADE